MGRIAGVPNKVTAEIKNHLQNMIDGIITGIDISKLDINRIYRYIEKYIKENASGTTDKCLDDYEEETEEAID